MTNKTQVQGDFYLTDWITFQGESMKESFFKSVSTAWKLFRKWI